jgi:copper(I)-binding protein
MSTHASRSSIGAGRDTAAYLVIANATGVVDTLVSASSADAASVGLQETMADGSGMTGMQPMTDLAARASLDLELHVKNAGTVTVKAQVKQP